MQACAAGKTLRLGTTRPQESGWALLGLPSSACTESTNPHGPPRRIRPAWGFFFYLTVLVRYAILVGKFPLAFLARAVYAVLMSILSALKEWWYGAPQTGLFEVGRAELLVYVVGRRLPYAVSVFGYAMQTGLGVVTLDVKHRVSDLLKKQYVEVEDSLYIPTCRIARVSVTYHQYKAMAT